MPAYEKLTLQQAATEVLQRLQRLCIMGGIKEYGVRSIFSTLCKAYCEENRRYHTLKHVADLLRLSEDASRRRMLEDVAVVDWSILWHDFIYDPQSSTNEEDSAQAFLDTMKELMPTRLKDDRRQKVADYILATKSHDVSGPDHDRDLQYFVDWDMSILGRSNRSEYAEYCENVRFEYSHLSDEEWKTGRIAFLEGTLYPTATATAGDDGNGTLYPTATATTGDNSNGSNSAINWSDKAAAAAARKTIFATVEVRNRCEDKAWANMQWELEQLHNTKVSVAIGKKATSMTEMGASLGLTLSMPDDVGVIKGHKAKGREEEAKAAATGVEVLRRQIHRMTSDVGGAAWLAKFTEKEE